METTTNFKTKKRPFAVVMRVIGLIVSGVALAGIFAFIFGYFVMLLWNWLMPDIFGLTEINYWQAFGIIILARLIFGILGGHKKPHDDDHHHEMYFKNWVKNGIPPWRHKKPQNFRKWKYYNDFWNEKGKEAFDKYIKSKEKNDIQESSES